MSKRKGFDWYEYDSKKNDFLVFVKNNNVEIVYVSVFKKGQKALMGVVAAAKKNMNSFENVQPNSKIIIYSF